MASATDHKGGYPARWLLCLMLFAGTPSQVSAAGKTDPWFERALQEQRTASLGRLFDR